MRLLYVDLLYDIREHKKYNMEMIQSLAEIADVTVFALKGYYSDLPESIPLIEYDQMHKVTRYFWKMVNSYRIMRKAGFLARNYKFDAIWCSTFHNTWFAFGRMLFPRKSRFYLVHQYNTDALSKKWDAAFFSKYKNKVFHIVAEEFFKKHLCEQFGVFPDRVFTVLHPAYTRLDNKKIYDCVGISNSNDEAIIKEIVAIEKKKEIIKKNKLNVILRSRDLQFNNGYLNVIQGFIPAAQYEAYINHAKFIYMPFIDTFRYRISGTLIEALSAHERVCGTAIPLLQEYAERYPHCCFLAKDAEEFIHFLCEETRYAQQDICGKEFDLFERDHNRQAVVKQMNMALRSVK